MPDQTNKETLLTYPQAAQTIGKTERTIRNYVRRGLLKRVGVVRPVRFKKDDVEALVTAEAA